MNHSQIGGKTLSSINAINSTIINWGTTTKTSIQGSTTSLRSSQDTTSPLKVNEARASFSDFKIRKAEDAMLGNY